MQFIALGDAALQTLNPFGMRLEVLCCVLQSLFYEGRLPSVSSKKSSRVGLLVLEIFTWALVGVGWACFPFSCAILFQLVFSLGYALVVRIKRVSAFFGSFSFLKMGFRGLTSWASCVEELGRSTKAETSLEPLSNTSTLGWSRGRLSN